MFLCLLKVRDDKYTSFFKVLWIYGGRLFIGFASGSYSVIVPQYTSEIAEKQIRGSLGSYFQLQVNFGILFTYVMGSVVSQYFRITPNRLFNDIIDCVLCSFKFLACPWLVQ